MDRIQSIQTLAPNKIHKMPGMQEVLREHLSPSPIQEIFRRSLWGNTCPHMHTDSSQIHHPPSVQGPFVAQGSLMLRSLPGKQH